MRGSSLYAALAIVFIPFYGNPATADVPRLTGVPDSPDIRGQVFAEAWLVYRREMDGLTSAKVRAKECEAWFDGMPQFLLRDTLRLAADPEVIYQSAIRSAQTKTADARQLIRDIRGRFGSQLLGWLLDGERIRAGDVDLRSSALVDLKSPIFERRRAAAVKLTAAGAKEGFAYLRSTVKKDDEEGRFAAWALGRFGNTADENLLRAELVRRPRDTALEAALGSLLYQRVFPDNHLEYLRKYRFLDDGASQDGMYEQWHIAVLKAVEKGVRDVDALRIETIKLRKDPGFGDDLELSDRRLAAFVDFLDEQRAIGAGKTSLFHPAGFQEALDALREKGSAGPEGARKAAHRIAASILLISVLGPKVDYPTHAAPAPGVFGVSPNADRVLDGNIATSRHLREKTPLVLEHPRARYVRSVFLLLFCGAPAIGDGKVSVSISGVDTAGRSWTKTQSLRLNLFQFQEIPIGRNSKGRIQVIAKTVSPTEEVCLCEARFNFNKR